MCEKCEVKKWTFFGFRESLSLYSLEREGEAKD